MEDRSTELCEIKVKIKLQVHINTIILTDVYYVKSSKNIIISTKFMSKCFETFGKGEKIVIIKYNKNIISRYNKKWIGHHN